MSSGSIARRYARALMELGVETGHFETYGRELEAFAQAMAESSELRETLSNPAFPRADRKKIVAAIADRMSASKDIRNTLQLLVDRERIGETPHIARELQALIDERAATVTAEVTSAIALSPDQVQRLTAALEKISGKKVQLKQQIDETIIGGAVAKLGDNIYDGSLTHQLRELGRQMAQ